MSTWAYKVSCKFLYATSSHPRLSRASKSKRRNESEEKNNRAMSGNPAHRWRGGEKSKLERKKRTKGKIGGGEKDQAPRVIQVRPESKLADGKKRKNCVTCHRKLSFKVRPLRKDCCKTYCVSTDMLKTLLWGSVLEGAVCSWLRHVGVELQNKPEMN